MKIHRHRNLNISRSQTADMFNHNPNYPESITPMRMAKVGPTNLFQDRNPKRPFVLDCLRVSNQSPLDRRNNNYNGFKDKYLS